MLLSESFPDSDLHLCSLFWWTACFYFRHTQTLWIFLIKKHLTSRLPSLWILFETLVIIFPVSVFPPAVVPLLFCDSVCLLFFFFLFFVCLLLFCFSVILYVCLFCFLVGRLVFCVVFFSFFEFLRLVVSVFSSLPWSFHIYLFFQRSWFTYSLFLALCFLRFPNHIFFHCQGFSLAQQNAFIFLCNCQMALIYSFYQHLFCWVQCSKSHRFCTQSSLKKETLSKTHKHLSWLPRENSYDI